MGNVGQARDFFAAHCGLPRWKVAHYTAVVEDPSGDLAAISTCCDGVDDAERMLAGALAALTGNVPWLRGLSLAGTDGQIKCSTEPNAIGLNVSDRPYFQNALHSGDFALSDYLIIRLTQLPSLIATYPAVKDDGSINAVVLAVIVGGIVWR